MTSYIGKNVSIETGLSILNGKILGQELIEAQEAERQARAAYLDAHKRMVTAQKRVRSIETEIANRSFADAPHQGTGYRDFAPGRG